MGGVYSGICLGFLSKGDMDRLAAVVEVGNGCMVDGAVGF